MGANRVAAAIQREATQRKLEITVIRNGSRGMLFLEPLVEVLTPKGRVAYGPVQTADVPSLFDSGFLTGGAHPLCQGPTEEIPYFKKQERLTFARVASSTPCRWTTTSHTEGTRVCKTPSRSPGKPSSARSRNPDFEGERRGVPYRHQVEDGLHRSRDRKYIVCNADEGDSEHFPIAW